jgi:NAD+-dependent protein deacetylase sirtuin 5
MAFVRERALSESAMVRIHGSLHEFRCVRGQCGFTQAENWKETIVPALKAPNDVDIGDEAVPLPPRTVEALPHCPRCNSLLRPATIWFGEPIPKAQIRRIDAFITPPASSPYFDPQHPRGKVDLMMVVGTGAQVWPAAGYVERARKLGAKVAVFNLEGLEKRGDDDEEERLGWGEPEWYFVGDAAEALPVVRGAHEERGE